MRVTGYGSSRLLGHKVVMMLMVNILLSLLAGHTIVVFALPHGTCPGTSIAYNTSAADFIPLAERGAWLSVSMDSSVKYLTSYTISYPETRFRWEHRAGVNIDYWV